MMPPSDEFESGHYSHDADPMEPDLAISSPMDLVKRDRDTRSSTGDKITRISSPLKSVICYAVNYEVAMVDQFCRTQVAWTVKRNPSTASQQLSRQGSLVSETSVLHKAASFDPLDNLRSCQPAAPPDLDSPQRQQDRPKINLESTISSESLPLVESRVDQSTKRTAFHSPRVSSEADAMAADDPSSQMRRSAREKQQREAPRTRTRVRYDMQLVPSVLRNRSFLKLFADWWRASEQPESVPETENVNKENGIVSHSLRRSSRLTKEDALANPECPCSSHVIGLGPPSLESDLRPRPFMEDSSVVWIPSKRAEWEDTITEMTAVCTSASLRKYLADPLASGKKATKPFHAPLSREYIRDRIDIDDPLNGFQIRHKVGGWLQGFVLWTNFTTWTHYFRFDSLDEQSGIPTMDRTLASSRLVDFGGVLAAELESQHRSGDPLEGGIIFDGVAEIALLGALGCGEYALRMALDDIRRSKQTYKFVVLEAADTAITFYERFGFVRVGAVCRYLAPSTVPGQPPLHENLPVVGYRHWTHANESQMSLELRGPSYMMCLKLPQRPDAVSDSHAPSLLDVMMEMLSEVKPRVEPLGTYPTPKSFRRSSSSFMSPASEKEALFSPDVPFKPTGVGTKRGPSRRASGMSYSLNLSNEDSNPPNILALSSATAYLQLRPKCKRTSSRSSTDREGSKRPRLDDAAAPLGEDNLFRIQVAPETYSLLGVKADSQTHSPMRIVSVPPITMTTRATAGSKLSRASLLPSDPGDRAYHSVRGTNGRFTRASVEQDATMPSPKTHHPRQRAILEPKNVSEPGKRVTAETVLAKTGTKAMPIERSKFAKQKVKSYPRSRIHYYNRVVKHKKSGLSGPYFFVIHYDEDKGTVLLVPMEARGTLTGQREGRPRYQAIIEATDANFSTHSSIDFVIVAATMTMKTPIIANEAWDIEE